MPLDPHAQRLLGLFAAGASFETVERTALKQRDGMLHLSRAVDVKDVPVGGVRDVTVPGGDVQLRARIYTPIEHDAAPMPGIVYFHGGMGVFCDLDTHDGLCRLLSNASGCRVISVDYRLAPEHPYPAAVDDAVRAVRWVSANAAELGIDARRIAVAGDSAGGTLAAVSCLQARADGGPPIALQLFLCPVTDLRADSASWRELGAGHFIDRATFAWAREQYLAAGANVDDERVSPLRARDLSRLPPAHVHTAEFDPVRDDGRQYADALAAAGVPVRYVCHAGMIHHFYCMAGVIPAARAALADIGASVREAFAVR